MTNDLIKRKVNKGEWSEIYAFFKILDDKILNTSDANLAAIPGKFVDVYKVVREEKVGRVRVKKIYDLQQKIGATSISDQNEVVLKVVDLSGLKNGVKEIFKAIREGKGTFEIPEAESLMEEFLCSTIKAASSDKSDIRLVIHDRHTPEIVETGFSIKSEFGALPTLLNPSRHTTFLYEVVTDPTKEKLESVPKDRVRDRVQSLYDSGKTLNFIGMESPTFRDNLQKIDTAFPEIIASILALYYRNAGGSLEELARLLPDEPALKKYNLTAEAYELKLKLFLEAIALGMTPSRSWNGRADAQGGYIVVKQNGEIVCFHMYNRDKFMDYLFKNTKLDTPGTHRYGFGTEETSGDGRTTLKLNLQIRFK